MAAISEDMTVPSNYDHVFVSALGRFKYGLMSAKSMLKALFVVFVFEWDERFVPFSNKLIDWLNHHLIMVI